MWQTSSFRYKSMNMIEKYYIRWVRSGKGIVKSRQRKRKANNATTKVGHGITDPRDGLGNTTPHVVYKFE